MDVKVTSYAPLIREQMRMNKAIALEIIGQNAERIASGYAPVDTGRLRASISHVVDDDAVIIGTNVEYAPYQELGTHRMQAANGGKGFLRPAITEHLDEYRKILVSMFGGNAV